MKNLKFKIKNFERGFTLTELLISLMVLISVGVVAVTILTSSLRGANKTSAVNNIRQNGSYAMIQMSRAIQYAKKFDGVKVNSSDSYTTNCVQSIPPAPTPTPTPAQYKFVKVTSFDGGQTVFSCDPTVLPNTIASNGASLLDTDSVSLGSSCLFTCTQGTTIDSPIINISFSLSSSQQNLAENKVTVPFNTSVTVRNPQR